MINKGMENMFDKKRISISVIFIDNEKLSWQNWQHYLNKLNE